MSIVQWNHKNYFEHHHWICFEETNLVGNVYFANYVVWQGHCRERFLFEYAPDVVELIKNGLALITLKTSCEYFQETFAFEEVIIRMDVEWIRQNRMAMRFEYIREKDGVEEVVARGEQQTAAMVEKDGTMVAVPFPDSVLAAIEKHGLMNSEPSRP